MIRGRMAQGICFPAITAIVASGIATDPVTAPLTRRGMWLFGLGVEGPHVVRCERGEHRVDALDPAQRFLERIEARYRGGLAWSIRNRFLVLAGALATILVGIALYPKIGMDFLRKKYGLEAPPEKP